MSFRIENEKILGKYKAFWSKIKNFKNIELIAIPQKNQNKNIWC